MKNPVQLFICLLFLGLLSCENEGNVKSHLESFDTDKYYSEEIIPADYQTIYGKWRLYDISGGFSGNGYEPDYEYLELKSTGIYGLVRNNILFEYGKIELDTFDIHTPGLLQMRLISEFHSGQNPYMYSPGLYIGLTGIDTLNIYSPCCDMYNYHHKRIK